jgi:hypothetical protein
MDKEVEEERRKRKNADVISRMRSGDPLVLIPSSATWFPPRPLVEKDKESIKKLYGTEDDE